MWNKQFLKRTKPFKLCQICLIAFTYVNKGGIMNGPKVRVGRTNTKLMVKNE